MRRIGDMYWRAHSRMGDRMFERAVASMSDSEWDRVDRVIWDRVHLRVYDRVCVVLP